MEKAGAIGSCRFPIPAVDLTGGKRVSAVSNGFATMRYATEMFESLGPFSRIMNPWWDF